jgi:uncharacterized protein
MLNNKVDYFRPQTWISYSRADCQKCHADCCRLPVDVTHADLVRLEVASSDELEWDEKATIKRLKKEGIIGHYDQKRKMAILTQFADNRCLYLRQGRCIVYEKRPQTCRKFPEVGPRPNFCPYREKKSV